MYAGLCLLTCTVCSFKVIETSMEGLYLVAVIAVQLETVYLLKGLGPPKEHPEDQGHLSFQEQVCWLQLRVLLGYCIVMSLLLDCSPSLLHAISASQTTSAAR